MRIQRKGKMYRVVWWIKPKMGLATNLIFNPRKPMMVKIFFRLNEHQLGRAEQVLVKIQDIRKLCATSLPASKRRYIFDHT